MKLTFISLAFLAALIVFSCASEPQTAAAGNFTNPNGSSELATLMNDMFNEAELAKQQIAQGQMPELKVDVEKMLTAAATEPEKAASDTYKAFAGSYLETVKNLKNCAPAEAPAHFQRMTEACMNCHNAICPGPTKRIRKLL